MSNANKTVTLTIDVQAEMSDLKNQVSKMQQMLGGLKLGDKLQGQVNNTFNDIYERVKKVSEYTENNSLDLINEKKVQSELNAIYKDFKSLVNKLNNNAKGIKFIDSKAYNGVNEAFEKYKSKVEEANKKLITHTEAVKRLQNALQQLRDNQNLDVLERQENDAKKIYNEAKKRVDDLEREKKEYVKASKSEPKGEADWKKKKKNGVFVTELAETYTKEAEAAKKAYDKAQNARINAEGVFKEKSKETQAQLEEERKQVNTLKVDLDRVTNNSFAQLKKELIALEKQGINLGFDPKTITSIDQVKEGLKNISEQEAGDVLAYLQKVGVFAQQTGDKIQGVNGAFSESVEQSRELLETLEQFKSKAAYFFGMVNAVNLLRRAVRSAFETVKDLDAVMTETAVVTDFSVGDMWAQLPEYTKRANELGVSIHDAYEAATLYYQQGLKTNEVIAVSNETLKMARIAGLGAAEATDRMTNALRGFNMEINEENAQRVNDVYSKLAAITAADTDEISTAMTKVASLAHNANMEFETTSAFLSQMIETTRESAETAGTALKTVIARFSEVKKLYSQGDLMGTDEEGEEIDVNKVSQALRSAGINLNEYLSGAKGLDDIFIELASKWEHLDIVQQRYIATMAAGSRQQSRFIAMMSDYDRTMQLVNAANTSAGASQKQFEKTLDSLQSKLAQLKNSWDTFLMGIADDKVIKAGIDILTKLIDTVNKLFETTDKFPVGGSITRIMGIVGALKLGQFVIGKLIGQANILFGATTKQTIAEMGLATATEAEIMAKKDEIAANQLSIFGIIKKTLASKAEAAAIKDTTMYQWLQNKATNGSIVSKLTLALTNTKLANTEKKLAIATGAVRLGLLALGAAVIYVGYKFIKFLTSSKSAKDSLDDATKSADAAADAVNQTAEAYNNLKDSMADLDDKTEALDEMVRGTREWRDAVQEVNTEVLQLMSQYEGLRIIREDGILKIDQASYDDVLEKRFEAQNNAQAALAGAQQKVAKLEVDVAFEELNLDNLFDQENAQVFLDRLNSGDFEGVKRDLSSVGFIDEEAANAVIEKLIKYGEAIQNSTAKTDEYSKVLAQVATSQANVAKDSEEYANNFAQKQIDSYKSVAEEEAKSLSSSKMRDKIAQAAGYKDYDTYEEKTGKEISKKDAEAQYVAMRQMQLASESIKQFAINLDNLDPIFKAIYSREDTLGLTGKMLERSGFNLDEAKKDSTGQAEVLRKEAESYWSENAKELESIYGNFDTFYIAYSKAIIQNNAAMSQAKEKFEEFGGAADALISSGALSDLGDNLQLIFEVSGKEAAQGIEKQISDITSQLTNENAEKFVNTLNSIDWTNANAIDRLESTLDGLGINIPDEQIENLTSDLIKCGNATRKIDLEKVTEQLEKMTTLSAKIRSGEQGRTGFDRKTVDDLVAAGIDRQDFQFDPFSGSWTYIGNSLDIIIEKITEQTNKMVGAEEVRREITNGRIFDETKEKNDVDVNNANSLRSFLNSYIASGGTGVSDDLMQKLSTGPARADNESDQEYAKRQHIYFNSLLPELQKAYRRIAEYSDNLLDNTTALEELTQQEEISNQISENTILTNAARGNTKAVAVQAASYGVPEEFLQELQSDVFGLAKIGDVYNQAEQLGIDRDELTAYTKELKKVNKELTSVGAAQTALANTRQVKGFDELVNNYEDWTALLDEDGNLLTDLDRDQAKVLSDMKHSVNDLLNVTGDLPDSFYESSENMLLLKKAIEEGGESIQALKVAALDSIIIDAEIDYDGLESDVKVIEDFLQNEAPTLEAGAVLDDKPFMAALKNLLANSKLSAEEVNKILGSMGVSMTLKPRYGKIEMPGGISAPGNGISAQEFARMQHKVMQDAIVGWDWVPGKQTTYTGNISSSRGYNSKSSGGGGGSSKSEKSDTWENPYDELYNLTEKINESLRTREALERRYEKLVKKTSSTVGEVTKAYYDQIRQLRTEADLQQQMQAGRARQLNNVGNEYYMDSEGNRSTFNSLGVTKYASYDQKTGLLQIDWSGLEALEGDPNKVEEGKAAEAYISRLEELQDQFEEVRDKLWDIEDQIEQLREEAIENYLTFEDRVMDALVDSYQRQIDEYSTLSDQIKEQTDAIIKGIQDDVALSRQIRDNTKKEEDIADKEARLAYLRRDTSGANALEIKKLEDEIANARESYSDTMVDQQIQQLQDDANNAAEQRQHQIDIMQHQLDIAKETGALWGEVWDLINTATAADGTFSQNSELTILLEETEAFQSLSKIGQMKWWEEVAEAFKRAQVGLSEAEDKYGVDANGDGKVTSSGTSSAISSTAAMSSTPASGGSATASTSSSSAISTAGSGHFAKVGTYEHPMAQMPAKEVSELQQALNAAGFTDNNGNKLTVDGKYGSKTRAAVTKLQQKLGNVKVDGYYGPETRTATLKSQFKAYKTGGLADYTGPAWLDGSKSHPELVLNAKDTENFIELKNILANSFGTQGAGGINSGDTYYEFNIDAELGSDYDVEKLADKIKRLIYNDSSYRNVNSINFMR